EGAQPPQVQDGQQDAFAVADLLGKDAAAGAGLAGGAAPLGGGPRGGGAPRPRRCKTVSRTRSLLLIFWGKTPPRVPGWRGPPRRWWVRRSAWAACQGGRGWGGWGRFWGV